VKDRSLPIGLYYRAKFGTYGYRESGGGRGASRKFVSLGKITREAAIDQWLAIQAKAEACEAVAIKAFAKAGTVAELIDAYIDIEMPRLVQLDQLSEKTAEGYTAQAAQLRTLFGSIKYAVTPNQALNRDVLRRADVERHMREFEGVRGQVAANRRVALLSIIFEHGQSKALCAFNPCFKSKRNREIARKNVISEDVRAKLAASLRNHPLRLIAALSDITAMRKVDVVTLKVSSIGEGVIHVTPSKTRRKTGIKQEFVITPAIRAILNDAAKLPGRKVSPITGAYVFPMDNGKPYNEFALQNAWQRAKKRAGLEDVAFTFRDLRTTELNAVRASGGDATATAGHADKRTTERHYLDVPTRVMPRR
jgi:integrase